MELISSGRTFFLKKVFPVVWLGLLGVFVVSGLNSGVGIKDPFFLLMPLIMIGFGIALFKVMLWDLADEVSDGGTFLLVRRGDKEERIPFDNIMNVGSSYFTNPRRITLRLRTPGKFGDEIAFIPKRTGIRLNPFARDEITERLILKVDRTRRQA